jgi:hypothetical protein
MKVSCALVACNENTHYLSFWPFVQTAWLKIVGIPCIMIYVGETLPNSLKEDPSVIHFLPIDGWPTATQAQCIRLLYPALLKYDGAIILSDMDIIPLQKEWFVSQVEYFDDSMFVSLRGIDEEIKQIYICYVAAHAQTWSEMFSITSVDDIRKTLQEWSIKYPADGVHGSLGWCTDQIQLYTTVETWYSENPDRIGLIPWSPTISRLDRDIQLDWYTYTPELKEKLENEFYVDFHLPSIDENRSQIVRILEQCLENNNSL